MNFEILDDAVANLKNQLLEYKKHAWSYEVEKMVDDILSMNPIFQDIDNIAVIKYKN